MARSLREVAEVHYGKSPAEILHEDGQYPVVGTGGVYGRAVRALFQGPAVVVPRKGSLGNPQYMKQPFWPVDTTYAVLPKQGVDVGWLYYSLARFDLTRLNEATGVPSISRDWLYKVSLGDADYRTQHRIAEILSTVDEAIAQTEALIAKTQQIKTGLMHDLFTRGLAHDGQLRPPPEEAPGLYKESLLGWIPKEWEVVDIRRLAALVTSGSRGWSAYYAKSGSIFLRSQNVRMGYLDLDDCQHVAPPQGSEGQRTKLRANDLLVTITGNSVGNVAFVPQDWTKVAFVSQHVGLVRLHEPELAEFAMNYFAPGSPGNRQLSDAQYGQSKPGLNLDNLRDLRLPLPSTNEREAIVERLSGTRTRIEGELTYARLMEELKQGLMHDLLTGRVRVPMADTVQRKEVAANG